MILINFCHYSKDATNTLFNRVIVVLEHKIYIYNFQNLKMVEVVETCTNPRGLCAVSPSKEVCVLAYPDKTLGSVTINHVDKNKSQTVKAH